MVASYGQLGMAAYGASRASIELLTKAVGRRIPQTRKVPLCAGPLVHLGGPEPRRAWAFCG
jgi:hypothetical protein